MNSCDRERGATLLDAVVGVALMTIVFVGIVGAFRLTVQTVSSSKARAGAIALANERLEYIRSLAYDTIGTVGGIPAGALAQSETILLNDVTYTRRTFVSYEDDPDDGVAPGDTIPTDYRAVKTSVTWDTRQGPRAITMITRISPPGLEQAVPGGTLTIRVTNAAAEPVQNAIVSIVNTTVNPPINTTTFTDADGFANMLGAPPGAGYEITVTKSGFSTARTYGPDAINTNPVPAHLAVALNQTTLASFSIDLVSSLVIRTFDPIEEAAWDDTFAGSELLGTLDDVEVAGGSIILASNEGEYAGIGEGVSVPVAPEYLFGWNALSWNDTTPANTDVRYRVYTSGGALIPDADLPGNGAGFTASPVSLASLSTSTYPSLRIGAELTSSDVNETPSVASWQIAYDEGPIPAPDVDVAMRGAKTIGSGPNGLVYKYSATHTTDASGTATTSDIEDDTYTLTVPASSGYDVASSCPVQPITVAPGTAAVAQLFLAPHTANSLLVDVRAAGGELIPDASVRLQRAGYDVTLTSDMCGQAFFSSLAPGSVGDGNPYSITVSASGYQSYTSNEVNVSGTTRSSVILNN